MLDPSKSKDSPRISVRTEVIKELTSKLNTEVNRIGTGPYQFVALLFGGGVYCAEGTLLLMVGICAKALVMHWNLTPLAAGGFMTSLFIGLIFGTFVGGWAGDRFGRRLPILFTYVGITVTLNVIIISPNILFLLFSFIGLGFFLGIGVPSSNAIVCESCPTSTRSDIYSMTMVLFSLGQIYAAGVLWILNPHIDHENMEWERMLVASALLPFLLLIFGVFLLHESPHWLISRGRVREAADVLATMAKYRGMEPTQNWWGDADLADADICADSTRNSKVEEKLEAGHEGTPLLEDKPRDGCCAEDLWRVKVLFSDKYRLTTTVMCFVCFASIFCYVGMVYALPDTLAEEPSEDHNGEDRAMSPALGVLVAASFELPGVALAVVLGHVVGRKLNISIAFTGASFCLAVAVYAIWHQMMGTLGIVAIFGVKFFIAAGFIVNYLYLLECYPTKFRATGLAFCMVVGRLGGFSIFVYDAVVHNGYSRAYFFGIMGALLLAAAALVFVLPYETKDVDLNDD